MLTSTFGTGKLGTGTPDPEREEVTAIPRAPTPAPRNPLKLRKDDGEVKESCERRCIHMICSVLQ